MIKVEVEGCILVLKGGERRGIWACVFEFIIRCKDTWSPIIDGTRLLIMNLSSCYRLSL